MFQTFVGHDSRITDELMLMKLTLPAACCFLLMTVLSSAGISTDDLINTIEEEEVGQP